MPQNATSTPVTQTVAEFTTTAVTLSDGWHGEILRSWTLAHDTTTDPPATPTADDWTPVLNDIIHGGQNVQQPTMLKDSGSNMVYKTAITLRGRSIDIVCKHDAGTGVATRLRTALRGSSAKRDFKLAVELLRARIPTAPPLAYLQNRTGAACLITEAIDDAMDLDTVAGVALHEIPAGQIHSVKNRLVNGAASMCAAMARSGFRHRDFKASNILVTDITSDRGPRLWLVDLKGISRGPTTAAVQTRPLVRLGASLAQHRTVTRTDTIRFVRAYVRHLHADDANWRGLWRTVAEQARKYNQRAKRRKRGKIDGYTGD